MNDQICEGPILNQSYGWICPKCGAALSPDIKICPNCSNERKIVYNTQGDNVTCTWNCENGDSGVEQMIFS